jgi:hypothetical protein
MEIKMNNHVDQNVLDRIEEALLEDWNNWADMSCDDTIQETYQSWAETAIDCPGNHLMVLLNQVEQMTLDQPELYDEYMNLIDGMVDGLAPEDEEDDEDEE